MENISSEELANEFVELLKLRQKETTNRLGHLRYEKVGGFTRTALFPLRLGATYTGRLFFSAPILSFVESGFNDNFPDETRKKNRQIVKEVYGHLLRSAYSDTYRAHFYQRVNPSDSAWSEYDTFYSKESPDKRLGW